MLRKFSTFVDLLRYRALHQPDQIAFTFLQDGETELGRLTYQELDRQARAIAAMLQSLNAKGERALLLYPPGLEFICAFFGCLYAGAIAVPAYPPRPNRSISRVQAIVADAQARFALTAKSLLTIVESRLGESETEDLRFLNTDNLPSHLASDWQDPGSTANSLAFLQYTSGSTGTPKGVMVSHGNLLYNSGLINQCFQDTPNSQGVSWLPPYHDMGLIGGILQPIYVGASMALISPVTFLQRPFRWLQAITRYQATTSGGPNFAYDLCVSQISPEQKANLDLSSWQLAFTGAEPVRAATLERFAAAFADCGFRKEAFYPCYGMAETTLIVSGGLKEALPLLKTVKTQALEQNRVTAASPSDPESTTLVGCGRTIAAQQILIVNPHTFRRSQEDQIGEIWVSGQSVAQGYWQRPKQTEETFGAYLADNQEGSFLRTGDLGFLQDGELFVTGRLKDLIIIRGRNHYPQDIELTVAHSHQALRPGCGAALSVTVEGEERLVIVQEIQRSYLRNLDAQAVISSIRKAVVSNHELQPFAVLLLKTGSIPKTSSGKIRRHACKAGFQQGTLDVIGEWRESNRQWSGVIGQGSVAKNQTTNNKQQTTNNKQQVIQTWLVSQIAQRLGASPDEIDLEEPFASYGLDSVQAVRLSAELEDWLGLKLPPTLAYDYPTIARLARYLAEIKTEDKHPQLPISSYQFPEKKEAIAIIGIGCRFPGANNPEAFWQLLRNGKDAIAKVEGRWEGSDWGGVLEQVDQFDPQFFGISPREAQRMDPQQRLLLEVSWEALEWAGIAPDRLAGTAIGVFIGISSSDYSQLQLRYGAGADAYVGTGNAHSIAANRLSYLLDLRGPSLAVDTACSSSLVAVHLACQSLQNRECDRALVGGVNLILSPELTHAFSQAGMISSDGRCKTFDASADGYVRGEGCGVVVLKRLADAIKDGDNILAAIRGSAINQDGRSNGLTAPNGPSQQAVICQALKNAGVTAAEISYVEAHGTGTSLGDPIEVNSLKAVLMQDRSPNLPCWIGSVKTNIGHLEAAAGIAGLIKTVLSLQHQEIPPHLHLNQINPHIDLENTSIAIPTKLHPWVRDKQPRLAGVSSFGFGGTNAHVVLEEAPKQGKRHLRQQRRSLKSSASAATESKVKSLKSKGKSEGLNERPLHLLTLSAKTDRALAQLVKSYEEFLTFHPEVSLADVCFTANTGRSHFNHRLAAVADSSAQLREQLAAFTAGEKIGGLMLGQVNSDTSRKIAFLFTGQGSQYVGMGYQLYQTQPTFAAALDHCDEILRPYLEKPLLEVLYPETWSSNPKSKIHLRSSDDSLNPKLDETAYTQPALFALEYALAQLWKSWGIEPDAVMGHSAGEYVAACVAGVFSLEDGLKLIAERGRLMQALPQTGEMVAVFADEALVKTVIEPYAQKVAIAVVNGSESMVISGEREAVGQAIASFKSQGVKTKKLKVSHAFHSPLMEPMLEAFEKVACAVTYSPPKLKIISNLTGKLAGAEIATPQYWINHVLQPVQFAASMETLHSGGYQIFLEIGSQPTLLSMGRQCLPEVEGLWLPSLRPGKEDWQPMLKSLAALSVGGVKVDWSSFDRDYQRHRVILPTYPFGRQRYWLEQKNPIPQDQQPMPPTSINDDWFYQVEWQPKSRRQKAGDREQKSSDSWLIFADRAGVGETVAQQLEKRGHQCLLVYSGDSYNSRNNGTWSISPTNPEDFQRLFQEVLSNVATQLTGIIHLWSLDAANSEQLTIPTLEQSQGLGCGSVVYLLQTSLKQSISPRLWLVTRGTQPVESSINSLTVAQNPLWGLGKVIALEHPEIWGGIVDLDPNPEVDEAASFLTEVLNPEGEDQIAFRNGKRYVARLKQVKIASGNATRGTPGKIQASDSTYLITGGLGALGLKVAQWMAQQGAKHLVLVGRSGASTSAKQTLKELEQAGTKVLIAQADVSQEQDLVKVLEKIKAFMPPLRGIIHAAGILDDGILQGLSWERLTTVMAPKIKGTWNLHNLTQDLPLDFFVMFSSVASLLGSPGQGNYAAANAFMDAIAHYRQAKGLPALSINWGPWAETGMAATKHSTAKGLDFIAPEQGLQALAQLLGNSPAQVGVLSGKWADLRKKFPNLVQSPYFSEILGAQTPEKTKATEESIFEQLLAMSSAQREKFLTSYLQSSIAQVLQIKAEQISAADNLLDLGMDSLMVMEAINQLKGALQLMLYPREFYERPRIDSLAKYLAAEFERSYGNGQSSVISGEIETTNNKQQTANNKQQTTNNKLPGIVFILSGPRSGSTLLRVMLAGHSALSSPPELHLLPFATMAQRDRELAFSHLGEGLQRAFMELKGIDARASEALVADLVKQNRSISQVYALLQELAGDRLLVDKSPTYASSRETLERAEELFENAKYIHLVRHPYAAIESFCRLRMDKLIGSGDANPYQLAESIWANSNQNILDFFEQINPERHHQVRYEELVTEPKKVMAQLCQFLGISFDPSVLKPYEGDRMTDGVYDQSMSLGDPNFLNHSQIDSKLGENWKKIQLPHQLGGFPRRLAFSLNYELPFEAEAPSLLNDELKEESSFDLSELPSMGEYYLNVRGLNLCFCSWGLEDGPLVLCLHGILEQGAAWVEVALRLASKGYRVVAPDLRGHGLSDRVGKGGSYNLLDFLGDIDAIVEKLTDKPFTLVGHSLGSAIAAMFASIRPQKVKNLVLVETVLPSEVSEDEAAEQLATHLDYLASPPQHSIFPDISTAADRLRLATPALSESLAMKLAQRISEHCPGGWRWRWDPLLRTRAGIGFNGIGKSRYLGLLRQIKAPIALIYGDSSNFNRTEDLLEQQKAMPKAKRITLQGGHNLHLEAPSELAQVIVPPTKNKKQITNNK